mmetsp:Transcript_15238/g.35318  ORF Transcript_15238/g.35318 Transcript_15238/m.35318 type:complete len:280 (+) Transcript_15238:133-972(+)|eukprot:CAMPEP_0197196558 /NCGR_PEP_ID=MMETSP1423-20130617/32420_1 /TAXON_ID=476441 /ORGANISM="Pseudo-nitzschia heimii, Strain UNC1101" /LENGTH=279 /DNA_ID=CAMNT_0042650365 /DNA_START=132 /DNA_END=971 /DNA_ORIENTATION=-
MKIVLFGIFFYRFAFMPSAVAFIATPCPDVGRSMLRHILGAESSLSSPPGKTYTLDGEEIRGPITPLRNFILVKVKDTLTATSGGILLPDQSKERPTEGLVIAAGKGKVHPFTAIRIHNPIKEGMSVLYGKYDGKAIVYNDDSCQMIRDDDCLLYYEGVTMKLDNVFPVRDYVLVAFDEDAESLATSSGVVIASQVVADDVPCEGTVVKVGEGRLNSSGSFSPSPVSVGERVKFKDYAGNDVTIDGKPYSVVKMVDILCSLSKEAQAMREESDNNDSTE